MTPKDALDWLQIFGNAVWIFFAAGVFYAGVRYQFKELRKELTVYREENAKEHADMRENTRDHEKRIRRIEWRRPATEEE
jgi:hypothetical protein